MSGGRVRWWEDAVVYQVYPRSFQDSDGDGIGDLRGVRRRLGYLAELGVDAFWLSPIYPSPNADWGYDVSDHTGVDPELGALGDFDALVETAHGLGLRVILDLIPSHTSIEHAWFREHEDWYVWADERPNNWLSAFGGPAWTRDAVSGRYYLHSFFPEQPDLDWRNPEVREAMGGVIDFWRERGTDGFRVDAVDRMSKDPQLRDDPRATGPSLLPLPPEYGSLDHVHSRNAPGFEDALESLRASARDTMLVGEVFRPTAELKPYLETFDLVFAFEFMHANWSAEGMAQVIEEACALQKIAWVLSNHDFTRVASRLGDENVRLAAALQLTLPGTAFVYQGDELGLPDGPGADPPFDRAGRDRARHAMQWEAGPKGGFTTGNPWLPPVNPDELNVARQRVDPGSLLVLYRRLIQVRKLFGPRLDLVAVEGEVLEYRRGDYVVRLNFGAEPAALPSLGKVVLRTDAEGNRTLGPYAAAVTQAA
jgi:alpha-glucosidase